MQHYVRIVHLLSRLCGIVAVLLILLSILIVCQMIFVRAVLGQSAIWQTEFVTFALIAATFIGSPYVLLTRGHVNVDLIPLYASQRVRMILAFVASAGALLFCTVLFVQSLFWWHEAYHFGFVTSSMWRARLWIPYSALPVGVGILVLQYVADIWALATGRDLPFGLRPEDRP
ncbi:MAG: TRAP transporter small permease [Alphaproteobacteria bacterium]|nr:TRAP transporter small permease [Alphaproteobacteria bacterium]MCW5750976.1 TRAP transporter small permease [Alphaproteobacteria bacterium]